MLNYHYHVRTTSSGNPPFEYFKGHLTAGEVITSIDEIEEAIIGAEPHLEGKSFSVMQFYILPIK